MAVIGVMGEKRHEAKEILDDLMKRSGQAGLVIDIESRDGDVPQVDVIVAAERSGTAGRLIKNAGCSVLVMNPDCKEVLRESSQSPGLVITYGFNSKACVTASSVMDNEMQICIQRDLPTLNGSHLEQQEFSVAVDTLEKDPLHLLAAFAAIMVCNADVEKLKVLNQ
ncbi:MAG: hypothetical protein LBT59_28200 [Clostridiales bacterium]|jgi:hypothetical protein|nr:hypothetical protein [Clostridiales bacterium]